MTDRLESGTVEARAPDCVGGPGGGTGTGGDGPAGSTEQEGSMTTSDAIALHQRTLRAAADAHDEWPAAAELGAAKLRQRRALERALVWLPVHDALVAAARAHAAEVFGEGRVHLRLRRGGAWFDELNTTSPRLRAVFELSGPVVELFDDVRCAEALFTVCTDGSVEAEFSVSTARRVRDHWWSRPRTVFDDATFRDLLELGRVIEERSA